MQPQPLNRKYFPVLKYLLTMNFCGMVIEGVNCEISFIPITKEFHWFNDFVVRFTVLGTFECFPTGQEYKRMTFILHV